MLKLQKDNQAKVAVVTQPFSGREVWCLKDSSANILLDRSLL